MEQTVTELKAAAAKQLEKLEKLESGEIEEEDRERKKREALQGKDEESGGIDWGMGKANISVLFLNILFDMLL